MIRFIDKPIIGLALALTASCLGCSEDEPTASEDTQASTTIQPTENNNAEGTVEFTQEAGGGASYSQPDRAYRRRPRISHPRKGRLQCSRWHVSGRSLQSRRQSPRRTRCR